MDKSTISVAMFNSKLLVCQRVSTKFCIPPVVTGPPKASLRAVRTLLRRDADGMIIQSWSNCLLIDIGFRFYIKTYRLIFFVYAVDLFSIGMIWRRLVLQNRMSDIGFSQRFPNGFPVVWGSPLKWRNLRNTEAFSIDGGKVSEKPIEVSEWCQVPWTVPLSVAKSMFGISLW